MLKLRIVSYKIQIRVQGELLQNIKNSYKSLIRWDVSTGSHKFPTMSGLDMYEAVNWLKFKTY